MDRGTLKIRVSHHAATALGPGKADLIEAIHQTGSISAAAKLMGMSYRRAWELVNEMNQCFSAPLITTHPGGGKQGGAHVTELGFHLLDCYKNLLSKTERLCKQELDEISRYLAPLE
jgi:molybdate transport system regulatory protein